ncbi:MAG: serine O-acetyltransferase [Planctomycetales bacterium]|nr:serine O-acetyltransferase [Planctomycetales bacterium]
MPVTRDVVWEAIREEVQRNVKNEPILASFLHATILNHERLEDALSFHLATKLAGETLPAMLVRELMDDTMRDDPGIGRAIRADLCAVRERDPASHGFSAPFLYFKGFHALQAYRIAHTLWEAERRTLAMHLQSRISAVFAVDIHPAARIGSGILIDHGTGVVIGETAVVEDNVSMLHEVTLGGTGKVTGDRHPKIRHGVLIGAGAKILGNIEVGACAKIGAGSVVLKPVPAHATAAGVPAKIVGLAADEPSLDMDQTLPEDHEDGSGI